MPGRGCLIAWAYSTQAVESTRSAAAMSARACRCRLGRRRLDLGGELRTRREPVERRALEDRDELRNRGIGGSGLEPDRLAGASCCRRR